MRLLLALALWCGLVAGAQAQSSQQFLGYTWPNANESIHCSPTCTGASVEFNVPTFSGSSFLYQWLGINANGLGSICPVLGGCLGQFGVEWTGSALHPWYEFACTGGAGCGPVTPITGITISVGDTIKLTMLCTVACNGSDSEQWAVTLTDLTTNTACYVVTTGTHCGTSGDTLNWPLSNVNQIFYVFETDNADTWTPSARWSNATVTTGLPGSQTTINAPLSPAQASYLVGTGSGTGKTSSPSGPIGVNGNDFTFCAPITSASYNPCSASGYSYVSISGPTYTFITSAAAPGVNGGGFTATVAPASGSVDTTGANLEVAFTSGAEASGGGTVTNLAGQVFSLVLVTTGPPYCKLWYLLNPTTSATDTFAYAHDSGSPNDIYVEAWHSSGGSGSGALDQYTSATAASGTSLATGSITPTSAYELVFYGAGGIDFTVAPSVNVGTLDKYFTGVSSVNYGGVDAYDIDSGETPINATFNWDNSTSSPCAAIASFTPHS